MKAVLDNSVLAAAAVDAGPDGIWSEAAAAAGGLAGPELVLVETVNIIRRMELTGRVSRIEASLLQARIMRLDLQLFPFAPFAGRVWALRHNLTGYDAWHVAVAEATGCPLIKLDRRLSLAPGPTCRIVVSEGNGLAPGR